MPHFKESVAHAGLPWDAIQTVLLDMDGTLLDLHFDNTFFRQTVPTAFARQRGISLAAAQQQLHEIYRAVEGSLAWYDLDYWSQQLDLDIPLLKEEVAHLIRVHPQTPAFLQALQDAGKPTHLVTNAHSRSLAMKLQRTPIGAYFVAVHTSHQYGLPKENPDFWPRLQQKIAFDAQSTLLVDDSEAVLIAAQQFGIRYLCHIAAPSSTQPSCPSQRFVSVDNLQALMAGLMPT
ncbi:GMP/IMP nucleotidase [Candidatus Magnetaquicoccus inordinatus]|uniref:GMP/IMP nucleotidase n=1 Tax=Candidatus Magnetaquicoccus inordinatus TaxID=2496818 RepID=UPI00102C5E4B|nr:GMP/IMP nucleotidase [Candidatus Magnetaquicoccus inordinatus]